jgi:N-acetylglucosaminyl-diphospho-decaprenol L-rhamnosyltransferase
MESGPDGQEPTASRETVAVVVVTYNSQELLADLVASLGPGLGNVCWHLTVADNDSADESVAQVRRLAPDAGVVRLGRNAGYAAGINAAVAAAPPHTAVLVLNPDVRLRPGCVAALLPALRSPGTGIAVPHLEDGEGVRIDSIRREPTVLRTLGPALIGARLAGRHPVLGEVVTDPGRYAVEAPVDWAEGSTLLISDRCWTACGPWDESFFLYSEETDFALRAKDAGLATRFVPTARAVHLEGEGRTAPKLWALMTLNQVRLFSRRHGGVHSVAFWAAVVLREGVRALLGRPTNRAAFRALLSPRRLREAPGPWVVAG